CLALRCPGDEPRVGVEDHLDQDVPGVHLLLDGVALALADLDLVLHRDEHMEDPILHAHRLDAVLEGRLDLVLVARVRVDHVPALLRRLARLGRGRLGHRGLHHAATSSPTARAQTRSRTVMEAPTARLTAKTSTVRLRTCSRVGQETFFNSDHASSMKRRKRLTVCGSSLDYGMTLAGAIGLEPTTAGFGDQCSANCTSTL